MQSFLVTSLLPWRDTKTKVTSKRKDLIESLLIVSEDHSIIVIVGSMMAVRLAWCWRSSLELTFISQISERKRLGLAWISETPSTHPTSRPHIFANSSTHWGSRFQTYELMGTILIQTTTPPHKMAWRASPLSQMHSSSFRLFLSRLWSQGSRGRSEPAHLQPLTAMTPQRHPLPPPPNTSAAEFLVLRVCSSLWFLKVLRSPFTSEGWDLVQPEMQSGRPETQEPETALTPGQALAVLYRLMALPRGGAESAASSTGQDFLGPWYSF